MPLPSTQNYIEIAGIKDGIVILKNGEYRVILNVASINFQLKSEEEKNAIIVQFQNFLNALHFPTQIMIRSKRVDLTTYLEKMKIVAEKQSNEMMRSQAIEYVAFVEKLIDVANIMKKSFYICIGQEALAIKKTSFFDNLFKQKTAEALRIAELEYKRKLDEIQGKINTIMTGLSGMGLRARQLGTQEVINFFYQSYNPDLAEKQRLKEIDEKFFNQDDAGTSPNEEIVDERLPKNTAAVTPPVQTPPAPSEQNQGKVPILTNVQIGQPPVIQQIQPQPAASQIVPQAPDSMQAAPSAEQNTSPAPPAIPPISNNTNNV